MLNEHMLNNLSNNGNILIYIMMVYLDPFLNKFINKIMVNGKKKLSICIFREVLYLLKCKVSFQPFFLLKKVAFRTRQLFRLKRIILKKRKITLFKPFFLKSHNQLAYSINHIIKCAKDIKQERIAVSLCFVLLNCFFFSTNRTR